jgi:hypothetical protein
MKRDGNRVPAVHPQPSPAATVMPGERSQAPACWWQPAFEVITQQEQMMPLLCAYLELRFPSTYAEGATVLMKALVDQKALPPSDEFPHKRKRDKTNR